MTATPAKVLLHRKLIITTLGIGLILSAIWFVTVEYYIKVHSGRPDPPPEIVTMIVTILFLSIHVFELMAVVLIFTLLLIAPRLTKSFLQKMPLLIFVIGIVVYIYVDKVAEMCTMTKFGINCHDYSYELLFSWPLLVILLGGLVGQSAASQLKSMTRGL